jgi:oxygen-independent coproporphyrinogen III oxidase
MTLDCASPVERGAAGLYVHIPFCLSRCNYCAFVSVPHDPRLERRLVDALHREIEIMADRFAHGDLGHLTRPDTIYFGGGTPSVLEPTLLVNLLEECRLRFMPARGVEITVEMNPETVDARSIELLREAGVNRVSLGAQSLIDEELALMERRHSVRDTVRAYAALRSAGFDNISLDVIIGLPGQGRQRAAHTLNGVIGLNPEHVSVYVLEIKTGTKLDALVRSGTMDPPDDDLAADLYELACDTLSGAGYIQYEISNFCRTGMMSRHNLKYWSDTIFVGIGPGAHGMTGSLRYENIVAPDRYIQCLLQGNSPAERVIPLDPCTRFKDALIMGLRLTEGLDLDILGKRYDTDAVRFVEDTIGDLTPAGLFSLEGSRLTLTRRGMLLSNAVFSRWV